MSERTNTAAIDSHPLTGRSMSGADTVVQVLADEGVDTIFGYSGGAILPTYDAVFRYNDDNRGEDGKEPMPLIVPANEQGVLDITWIKASVITGKALLSDAMVDEVDADFLIADCGKAVRESLEGSARIRAIVKDLRAFSHHDSPEPVLATLSNSLGCHSSTRSMFPTKRTLPSNPAASCNQAGMRIRPCLSGETSTALDVMASTSP